MFSTTITARLHGIARQLAMALALLLACGGVAHAQNPVDHVQNFDSLGAAAAAELPANWRVDKHTGVRTVGTWAGAAAATEQRAGNNMSSTAANGIYNYGAGVATTATDRAIGWLSSGDATKSGNLYAWFQNDTGGSLASVDISYDVEKYRNGINGAGFSIQLYSSTDGVTWTSAGPSFLTNFPADPDNAGFASAPGAVAEVSVQTLALPAPVPAGGDFYLAWNYSTTSGTTTTNAQGLGIDNVSIGIPQAITLVDFSAAEQNGAILVTWETASELGNLGFNLYRGLSPAGPDRQLNATLIPSQGPGSTSGFSYAWEDRADLLPGASYSYWLEDLDVSGATTLHGPVSVDYVGPTAVKLSSVQASPAATLALPSLGVTAAAAVALGLSRVRRRASR